MPCSQKSVKSMVALSETNALLLNLMVKILSSPLLPSSKYYGFCFLCAPIEHMRLYLSVLAFLINSANTIP